MNKLYYHATSLESYISIKKQGFKCSKCGLNGAGVYFALNPMSAFFKSHTVDPGTIIVATINTGRLLKENCAHPDWNLKRINERGFDCVQTNCKSGSEICVYEPWRITIIEAYYLKEKINWFCKYTHESNPRKEIKFLFLNDPDGEFQFNSTCVIQNLNQEKILYGAFDADKNNISTNFTLFSLPDD